MKRRILTVFVVIDIVVIGSGILLYSRLPAISGDIASIQGTKDAMNQGIITDLTNYVPTDDDENDLTTTNLKTLIIQTEDRRYLQHRGVDLRGVIRALYYNIIEGRVVQGGSTIPQQLLKNYRGNTDRSRTHKMQEMGGAMMLTALYDKSTILGYYIDYVPFPNGGVTGYTSACEYYFDRQCAQLFESEILFLIALAQDGSNPYSETNFVRIQALRDQLCHKTDLDCTQISQMSPSTIKQLSWHTDEVDPRTRMVLEDYPSQIYDAGLTDSIQRIISFNRGLLESHQAHDCCIVVIGPGGAIMSYNQCRNYDERVGTIDLCRTPRQTGSAIKPFIYALAFDQLGYSGGTMIEDEAVSFDLGDGSLYQPKNFDNQYHGTVTLAQALGNSFNIPAIKLTHLLGPSQVISMINQLRGEYGQNLTGLESDRAIMTAGHLGLSVGLGTYELSPLEFARLWGLWYDTGQGERRREEEQSQYSAPHLSITTKQEIISILSNPLNRVISFGQDNLLNRTGWFVKTGTSRRFVDGRTCGGRTDREQIVCVRVGNHDVSSMDSSSVDTAGYLWYLVTQQVDNSL